MACPAATRPLSGTRLPCCRPELLQYYWLEMAFYISSQFMLVCWETRRSDFYAMFIHHCATNSLIMFSYHKRCAGGGGQGQKGAHCRVSIQALPKP